MSKVIEIGTGQMAMGDKETIISTSGIGSCVFICLYEKVLRIGGAVHAMLPSRKHNKTTVFLAESEDNIGKYVDEAIIKLVDDLIKMGGSKDNMIAKVVGGSSMFKIFDNSKIGSDNVKSAEKILQLMKIQIRNESVGGTNGRSASFNIGNGLVEVTIKM